MVTQALALAILLSSSTVAASPYASAREKDRQVSIVMVIGTPSPGGSLAYPSIPDLIKSTPIAGAAAAEILGIEPERYHQEVDVEVRVQRTQQGIHISLSVALDAEESARSDLAESYLLALVRRFRDSLAEVKSANLNALQVALDSAGARLRAAKQKQDDVLSRLKRLRATPGLEGMSPSEILFIPSSLRTNIRNYEATLANMRWRMSIENLADGSSPPASNESVIEAWQAVVDLRQARLEELRQAAEEGTVSPADVAEFEARLAEAKAALLTFSRPARARGVGPGFGGKRRGVGPIASETNIEQTQAQLSEAREHLKQIAKIDAAQIAREMLELEAEGNRLRMQMEPLEKEVHELERSIGMVELTTLEVIGEESLKGVSSFE